MSTYIPTLLAFAQPQGEGQQLSPLWFVPYVLIFAVFYFLVFRPMRTKQKRMSEMIQGLKTGDHVITSGGLHGKVTQVRDDVIQIRIADNVKVDVSKSAVAQMEPREEK